MKCRLSHAPALRKWIRGRVQDDTRARTQSSAVVFAPHPDDETLGCGGTMILKSESRTLLSCVFMTDGATSHSASISADELRRVRKAEALSATAVLGLAADHVHFLDFPDGRLDGCREPAIDRVAELLGRLEPDEVYVPYHRDGLSDHEATHRIVVEALQRSRRTTRVLEYPIWRWNRWPWVPVTIAPSRETLTAVGQAASGRFGLEMLHEFRTGVFVQPVLERKRLALAQHASQTTVLRPGRPWPTLQGIADGRFLDCFFQDFELFRVTNVAGAAHHTHDTTSAGPKKT